MNLGQAAAICFYELCREEGARAQRFPAPDTIGAEHAARLTELLQDALTRSGYVQDRTSGSTARKLRRLVLRIGMPAADAETWLGIFRQIIWKLKSETARGDGIGEQTKAE